jgi:hypothetical protein
MLLLLLLLLLLLFLLLPLGAEDIREMLVSLQFLNIRQSAGPLDGRSARRKISTY